MYLTTLSLVDALIKPILPFVSDFWGCTRNYQNPTPNKPNIGVLLELGRIPMHIYAAKLAAKNWERIKRGQANCVLLASYRDAIEVNLPWLLGIKSVLERNAMLNFYLNDYTNKPLVHTRESIPKTFRCLPSKLICGYKRRDK